MYMYVCMKNPAAQRAFDAALYLQRQLQSPPLSTTISTSSLP